MVTSLLLFLLTLKTAVLVSLLSALAHLLA
jgi:hypothetical protein